jgi:hypothetical protein
MTHASRAPSSSDPAASARAGAVRPRTPRVAFADVPRHWFADSAAATHVANGVNLLFPAGERFFVRAVKHYLDRVDDAQLAADVRGFFGQEGRHANAHEKFFEALRAQGYDVDRFLAAYERASAAIERASPPALRLAVTVALEHFTAIMAEDALAGGALAHAHPTMRRLLEWHAVEELEHKAVAFDVLRAVRPSYALRLAGLALGGSLLAAFWIMATRELLEQDGKTLLEASRELSKLRRAAARGGEVRIPQPIFARVFLRGVREYLRPSFHPNDKDHRALVADTLARLEREGVVAEDSCGATRSADAA